MDAREVFLEVAERGSFRRAAEALDISLSYASRRVRALEDQLEVQLLARTTRRVELTAAGQDYYARLAPLWRGLQALERETMADTEPSGRVRIALPLSFGLRRLQPLVTSFLQRWPDVVIDASFDDRLTDPLDYDVTVRGGQLADSSLKARRLCGIRGVLAAAPSYLAAHGTPARPQDLSDHQAVVYTNFQSIEGWRVGRARVRPVARYLADNGDVLVQAAVAGIGVVYQPDFLLAPSLASGELVQLLPGVETFGGAFWAMTPLQRQTRAVRELVEHLVVGLSDR